MATKHWSAMRRQFGESETLGACHQPDLPCLNCSLTLSGGMMARNNQKYQALRSRAEEKIAHGLVIAVSDDKRSEDIPLWQQGDLDLYTPEVLVKRHALRVDPGIIAETTKAWDICEVASCRDINGHLLQLGFVRLLSCFHAALMGTDDPVASNKAAADEFLKDTGGAVCMTFKQFHRSMFEVADLWCETIELEEYVTFLRTLLDNITRISTEDGLLHLRDVSELHPQENDTDTLSKKEMSLMLALGEEDRKLALALSAQDRQVFLELTVDQKSLFLSMSAEERALFMGISDEERRLVGSMSQADRAAFFGMTVDERVTALAEYDSLQSDEERAVFFATRGFSDVDKLAYQTMSEKEQSLFLSMSAEERALFMGISDEERRLVGSMSQADRAAFFGMTADERRVFVQLYNSLTSDEDRNALLAMLDIIDDEGRSPCDLFNSLSGEERRAFLSLRPEHRAAYLALGTAEERTGWAALGDKERNLVLQSAANLAGWATLRDFLRCSDHERAAFFELTDSERKVFLKLDDEMRMTVGVFCRIDNHLRNKFMRIRDFFRQVDKSGDGKLSPTELVNALVGTSTAPPPPHHLHAHLNRTTSTHTSTVPPSPSHTYYKPKKPLHSLSILFPFSFHSLSPNLPLPLTTHHSPLTTHSLLTNNKQQTNTNISVKIIARNGKNK
jgi:hypothetical protein